MMATGQARLPHILFIYCDELRADALGCWGETEVHTPHLDRLAARSAAFRRCYVQSPLCLPSRVSLATGRYVRSHGAYDNGCAPAPGEVPLYHAFTARGYATPNVGKAHFGVNPLTFGFSEQRDFDDGTTPFGVKDPAERARAPHKRVPGNLPLVMYGTHPRAAEQTKAAQVISAAIERLAQAEQRGETVFLTASLIEPHTPILPPVPYDTMYDPAALAVPPSFMAPLAGKPYLQRFYFEARRFGALSEDDFRRARAAYFGVVSHVDTQIGRLLRWLDEHALWERTIVVFTSDHGAMLGEHGWFEKWGHCYEEVVRVPLLISFPDGLGAGQEYVTLVESIDVLPTLLDFLGESAPGPVQGRSLLPLLRGERHDHRRRVFSELFAGGLMAAPAVMVRDDRWKLVAYPPGDGMEARLPVDHPARFSDVFASPLRCGELYDLAADPHELRNRYEDPAHGSVRAALEAVIEEWMVDQEPYPDFHAMLPPAAPPATYQFEQGTTARRVVEALQAGRRTGDPGGSTR